ncbi:MAG: MFS transporter, partial [Myxococcota bacterium]
MNQKSATLTPVLLVNFIGAFGFSIVMPFLVFLVLDFGGNAVIYGFIGAAYSVFQFLAAPVLGRWSDAYGRRRILLLSQAGTLFAWIIFVVALTVPKTELFVAADGPAGAFTVTVPLLLLFLARAIDGLTGGNISVANAYASDVSTDETRSRNFGRMGVSFNLGMVLGPAIAGVLGATVYGELLPVLGAVLISVLALVVIYFFLPESNSAAFERAKRKHGCEHLKLCTKVLGAEGRDAQLSPQVAKRRRHLLTHPSLFTMMVIFFVVMLGFNLFYAAMPMHAARDLGWDALTIGGFFSVLSASMVVVEGPVLSWLAKRSSEPVRIVSGFLILAVAFTVFWRAEGSVLYGAALLFAMGNGIAWP